MVERIHKLEIRITAEEIADTLTVDEWLDMEDGNKRIIVATMSRFMWYDGHQLSPEDGRAKVGALPLRQFNVLCEDFFKTVRDGAVPPGNGADSETPS